MNTHPSYHPCYRNRGFNLIEVLVALLIIAVGLLGLTTLQVTSLRFNHNAHLRSQATFLIDDILERMRANRQPAVNGNYNIDFGQAVNADATLVANDLEQWSNRVQEVLPDGEGSIHVNGTVGTATVSVRWNDSHGEAGQIDPLLVFTVTSEI